MPVLQSMRPVATLGLLAIVLIGSVTNPGFAQTSSKANGIDPIPGMPQAASDAATLTKAGIAEDIVLRKLKQVTPVDLTTEQIIYLTNVGVSQNVIRALMDGGAPNLAPGTANAAATNPPGGQELSAKSKEAVLPPPPNSQSGSIPGGGSAPSDPYADFASFFGGIWTATLDPGADGSPRIIEETFSRDPNSGGIALVAQLTTKMGKSPEGLGQILWDPKDQKLHSKYVRVSGETITGIYHRESNSMVLDGTIMIKDGASLRVRSIITISSADVRTSKLFFRIGDDLVFSATVRLVRLRGATSTPSNELPSDTGGPRDSAKEKDAVNTIAEERFESAKLVKAIPPSYPFLKRLSTKSKSNTVYVEFIVGIDGTVSEAEDVSNSDPAYAKSAVAAVKQWIFSPAKRNGTPVRSVKLVPIIFALNT